LVSRSSRIRTIGLSSQATRASDGTGRFRTDWKLAAHCALARPRLPAAMIFDRLRIMVIFSKRLDRAA